MNKYVCKINEWMSNKLIKIIKWASKRIRDVWLPHIIFDMRLRLGSHCNNVNGVYLVYKIHRCPVLIVDWFDYWNFTSESVIFCLCYKAYSFLEVVNKYIVQCG